MAASKLWHEVDTDEHVVLLAEDEFFIRFDIADELRQRGCQVIEAGSADEAIDVLRSTARIDIVVTDLWMPGKHDGFDVARTVREERPGVSVVVISAHLKPADEHKHLFDLFFPKPTPSERLARAIVEMIDAGPARRTADGA
ncbi:response regulator [Chelativorans sp. YIM 93263]|uniref:response regulator n=1 Tax=Chelativorans sp. YIM 93263 TaxID=2906648 RepID=UPI002377D329|nr:response regulator [Chelativorans sp. YIM 93263]